MSPQPGEVTVCECWPRDGIQGWPSVVETEAKVRMVQAIAAAGIREVDLTSFVPPHVVPQFSDAEEVLAEAPADVSIRVLTVNLRGAERVIESQHQTGRVDTCGIPFSASESHNIANLRRDHAAHRTAVAEMVEALQAAGIEPLLGVATAFGCPIEGRVEQDAVLGLVDWAVGLGVRRIMFGDTTGMAVPHAARELFELAIRSWPSVEFVAHFHDTRGRGLANTLAAIDAGVGVVDTCLGGIGGEPAAVEQGHVGETGNLSTEDLVATLDQSGIATGIDLDRLLAAGALAEEILGRTLRSQVLRTGLVRL
jgi:hydroxymethylglutaryl-CoA lyase